LWRIFEIIEGITLAVEAKFETKFEKMELKMKQLEQENQQLKSTSFDK
jgi:hypothetical protein